MARARSRGFAKTINQVHWTYGSFNVAAQTAGTVATNVYAAQHLPETLMRLRGEWSCYLDGVQAPGNASAVTVGMILVPDGSSTTVTWSPVTDGDAPWLWWDVFHLGYEEMVTDVIAAQDALARHRVIDSKVMRKIRNREVQFVAEVVTTLGSGVAVNIQGSFRGLFGT